MTVGQEIMKKKLIFLFSVGQPTKTVLTQTCMDAFFVRSLSDTISEMPFLPKPPDDRRANSRGPPVSRGPLLEKHCLRY